MSDKSIAGIYLVTEFDWPANITKEIAGYAASLHQLTQNETWIRETVAASGGVGGDLSSIWVFWLENYAALDRLLRDHDDPISQTYAAFFGAMAAVRDKIREEVIFM